jgi:pimeloyl-ACP methyl ester carboxylesterase
VNGVKIAHRVRGDGPPLVLVMGYRLNSTAWPASFIEQLAQQFTVITLDNRGTGLSDKPVNGYAIRNPDSGYLRAKMAQENLIKAPGIPYTILRSTQFFEFVGGIVKSGAEGNLVRLSPAMFQPIASDDVVASRIYGHRWFPWIVGP